MGVYVGVTDSYLTQSDQTKVADAVKKYRTWSIGKEGDPGRTPALDLNFAENKSLVDDVSGSNLVTFTRASTGTYVGSDGLIKTSPVNLFTNSNPWSGGTGVTWVSGQTSPTGGTEAYKMQEDTSNSIHGVSIHSGGYTANYNVTFSVFAKEAGNRYLSFWGALGTYPGVDSPECIFDLQDGVIAQNNDAGSAGLFTNGGASIKNYGNGWYRCIVHVNPSSLANRTMYLLMGNSSANDSMSFTGNGSNGILLFGLQREEGSTATDYIPTTSTISGAPRFDHDPVTGESLGLLVEESRTNLFTNSQQFETNWTQNQVSVTANQGIAPDGTLTADLVTTNTANTYNTLNQFPTLSTNTNYCYSVFVKLVSGSGTSSRVTFGAANSGISPVYASWGLQLDTLTETTDGNIPTIKGYISYPNGWYRLYMVINTSSQTNAFVGIRFGTGGVDNVATFYLWGAQLEAGSFPTSYIPTNGSTVTRAPDLTSITGNNLTSWYNVSEGSLYVDFKGEVPPGATGGYFGTNVYGWGVFSNGVYITNKGRTDFSPDRGNFNISNNQVSLYKGMISQSDIVGKTSYAVNGSLIATDVDRLGPYSTPSGFSVSASDVGSANQTKGSFTVKRTMYWGVRLSNSTLQSLTQ